MSAWWCQFLGLLLGFLGALFLVFGQQSFERGQGFERKDGSTADFVVLLYPKTWRTGLMFLCAGFLLQLAALFRG